VIGVLGVADNRLPFTLGYDFIKDGNSGFTASLVATNSAPFDVPRVAAKIQAAQASVVILPEEEALVLRLHGKAKLDTSNGIVAQAKPILNTVFGSQTAANLTSPPPFTFEQKFRLEDTGLPGLALGMPTFSVFPNWKTTSDGNGNDVLPEVDGADSLDLRLGMPRFSFQLPDLSTNSPLNPRPIIKASKRRVSSRPSIFKSWNFGISGSD
jgi:hypothetical protein